MSDEAERNVWSYVDLQTTDIDIHEDITFGKWEELGDRLHAFIEVGRWGLGKWAIFGERRFGEEYTRAVTPGRSRRIEQARWVFLKVPPEIRREALTWSHHRAVAGIDDRQLQIKLLDQAVRGDWNVATLAQAVNAAKKAGEVEQPGSPAEVTSATRIFGASGRVSSSSTQNDAKKMNTLDPAPQGFTPRVVAGKDVDQPDDPYTFLWAVVEAARVAIAHGEITDDLRKAVADIDALEAISKRSVG